MTRAIHGFGWALRRRTDATAIPLKKQFFIGVFVAILLASAFSVIYLKDLSRRLFIHYQQLQQVQQQAENDWSKLLLEEGAWSTQQRVQNIATEQLGMMLPVEKQIMMIGE